MTLLHYIALIVKEKYPELANFYNELHFVDKAAAGERAPNIKLCQQPFTERSGVNIWIKRYVIYLKYALMSACKVSLENVLLDVRELGKGMDLIRRECSLHDHSVLKGFVQASDSQLDKLQKDAKMAEVSDNVFTSETSNYPLEQMKMKPF